MRSGETVSLSVTPPNEQSIEVPEAVVRWSRGQEFAVGNVVIEPHTRSVTSLRQTTGAGTSGDCPVSDNQPMFLRFNIAFVLSFVCLATPAWPDYEAGEGAYQRGDYATALRELRPLAEQGNHSAQFFMGVCYANGYGVPKNLELALQWYRLSSDQGNWLAQNDLGVMYQNGDGVLQDYEEAARLYRLGADKGYMVAQSNLAAMYYKGRGVRQDVREAFRLETLAAEQNFALAQRMLGIMYMVGTGIPQDYVQAHKWLNLSTAQGDTDAGTLRDELAKKMTLDQIAEAQKLAREWTPKGK